MKKLLLIICFIGSLLNAFFANATTNVYVSVAGQSECWEPDTSPINPTVESNWITVGQPIFAADVLAATGWTVNFINGCIGSTGLLQESYTLGHGINPAWLGNPPSYTEQTPYTSLLSAIGSNTLKAALWLGSESDNSDNPSDLQGGLQALATHFQTDLGNSSLPVIFDVYGQDTEDYSYSTYPSWTTNQLAEIAEIPTIPHGYLGAMAYDMSVSSNGIHWNDSTPMAHRMANAFLYAYGYSNYIRGPYIKGATVTGSNTVTVSVQQNPASTGWTAVSNPVGFQIFNWGTAVTISNVVLTNPSTITITTSGMISSGYELRYMMDINPANLGVTYNNTTNLANNIPRDNTPLALPLEIYDGTITETITSYAVSGTVSGAPYEAYIALSYTGTSSGGGVASGTSFNFNLAPGTYTITPSLPYLTGYTFSPASQTVTVANAAITGVNFTASADGTNYTLTTTASTGVASITSSPSGISCPSTCSYSFNSGTGVSLSSACSSGYQNPVYSGACSGSSCSVTMNAAEAVTATCSAVISGSGNAGLSGNLAGNFQ